MHKCLDTHPLDLPDFDLLLSFILKMTFVPHEAFTGREPAISVLTLSQGLAAHTKQKLKLADTTRRHPNRFLYLASARAYIETGM